MGRAMETQVNITGGLNMRNIIIQIPVIMRVKGTRRIRTLFFALETRQSSTKMLPCLSTLVHKKAKL